MNTVTVPNANTTICKYVGLLSFSLKANTQIIPTRAAIHPDLPINIGINVIVNVKKIHEIHFIGLLGLEPMTLDRARGKMTAINAQYGPGLKKVPVTV